MCQFYSKSSAAAGKTYRGGAFGWWVDYVAVNRSIIAKNPANDVTLPKKVTTAKTILNGEQLERFMAAIKADEHWHDFFYLEITTGLRQGV